MTTSTPAPAPAPAAVSAAPELRVFEVALANKAGVQAALVALQKKAVKKGVDQSFDWSWGRAYTALDGSGAMITLVIDGVSGLNGWVFVSSLIHMKDDSGKIANLVRNLPFESTPAEFRSRGPVCDHCKALRRRNETYVLRHTESGEHVQVGSTCIEAFLGAGGDKFASLASILAAAVVIAEGGKTVAAGAGGHIGMTFESGAMLTAYMPFVAACARVFGWVTRKDAYERRVDATADVAFAFFMESLRIARGLFARVTIDTRRGSYDASSLVVTDADRAAAAAAIAWAEDIAEDTYSDYLHNCRAVAACNVVSTATLGVAASIFNAYTREEEKRVAAAAAEARRAPKASMASSERAPDFFGAPGERGVYALTLAACNTFETQYGTTFLYRFKNEAGSVAVWRASSDAELVVGKTYYVTGTIKEHAHYKTWPQTVLTRCKAVDAMTSSPPAAPKARAKKASTPPVQVDVPFASASKEGV